MNFQFKHMVYPVGKMRKLIIEPVFPVSINESISYSIIIHPFSGIRMYGLRVTEHMPTAEEAAFFGVSHPLCAEDGMLHIEVCLLQEDCYICDVYANETKVETLEIYALADDMLSRTPFKGDNHMHTWMSDGKDSPMYMAAAACRHGCDYCVITDHRLYEPSLIARDFYKPTGVDFLVIPGEEVHSPDNPVHIINLGGKRSVNDWFRDNEAEYREAVEEELGKMDVPMLDKTKYAAAASQVMFDRIRDAEGVAVLCHPCWIIKNGYNEAEDITEYLLDNKRFDALELIAGGAYEDGTQLQISYYKDRAKMPVLGSSDSHGCFGDKLEPGNFTIVFANEMTAEAIKDAIRAGYTVAGNGNKLYGDYRLVKYSYFLMRNYYPKHIELRSQLGARMLRYASSQLGSDSYIAKTLTEIRPSELFAPLRSE